MYDNPQDEFMELINSRFPKKLDAVEYLSQLLHLGKDAVYRRLRGEKTLTYDEVVLLAKDLNISLDNLIFKEANIIPFTFNGLNQKVVSFDDYLTALVEDIQALSYLTDVHIYYASSEIPIFFYCMYPELIKFKLFVWGRTVWNNAALINTSFNFDLIPVPTIRIATELLSHYKLIDSTELWNLNIIDNTLNQIEYHLTSGAFEHPQDALILNDRLLDLIEHMRLMAGDGRKYLPNQQSDEKSSEFNLFHNEMIYTNNTILVRSKEGNGLYTSFGNPNFLKTNDARVCDFTFDWFSKIMDKSNSISSNSEKVREQFFGKLKQKVESARSKLEYLIQNN